MISFIQNNFTFGSIGERLTANRTSEIYRNGVKDVKNMLITDLGTLKIAKQFKSDKLSIEGTVVKVLDIKSDKYVVLTSSHLYQLSKANNQIVTQWVHSMGVGVDCSLIGRDYIILFNTKSATKFKLYQIDASTEYKSFEYMNPLKDKKVVELSLWRASLDPLDKEKKKFRVVPMSVAKDPKVKIHDGKIYLSNSNIQIKRIYIDYNNVVDDTYFDKLADGDIYGILRIYYKPKQGETYVVGNTPIIIGSLSMDNKYKGQYFTSVSGNNTDGEMSFGKLVDISKPTYISFYQDRTVFYVDNYLYFSKTRDYFNFRNDIQIDAPFFIQLNPINNRIGDLLGMISSNNLLVLTTAGTYSIGGQGVTITPQSISGAVMLISDMSIKNNIYSLLDNVLYFKNSKDVLKVVMIDNKSLQLNYNGYTVDKYSTKDDFNYITTIAIEDKDYIMASSRDNKTMYLIEKIDEGLFRKVSLEFTFEGRPFGISDRFIIGNKVYSLDTKNYRNAYVKLNNPLMTKSNNILVDNSSSITSVAVQVINEDFDGIKEMSLSNRKTQQLKAPHQSDIYKIKTKLNVKRDGISIDIVTKENDKVIELLAIQGVIDVIEDK